VNETLPAFDCRFCGVPLKHTLIDLGVSPLCESFVHRDDFNKAESFYPLHVYVCHECKLAQIDEFVPAEEIFTEYAYFSSYSDSWVAHARAYCEMMTERFALGSACQVVELASNDGYLLQHFNALGVPNLGIEPAANVARAAEEKGVKTRVEFFGAAVARQLVDEGYQADVVLGNNVLAQVPDLNDFVAGISILLKAEGVVTIEFPHLKKLIDENQFDTIYHEHYGYFSLLTAERIFAKHGMRLFDVEELPSHGGSLRIFGCLEGAQSHSRTGRYQDLMQLELDCGYDDMSVYEGFTSKILALKNDIIEFFIQAQREGKTVAGYGAPGKGNTLLNYCGIKSDWLTFTCDRNPYKHGRYLPGSRVPILPPEALEEEKPDYVIIMPWNLREEITQQLSYVSDWGAKLVTFVPQVEVFDA